MQPDGSVEQKAGHAWAEAFVADIGWIGFDPVHDICPQEAHVRIACGLDYLGAAPVLAACAGGTGEAPTISVRVGQKRASVRASRKSNREPCSCCPRAALRALADFAFRDYLCCAMGCCRAAGG